MHSKRQPGKLHRPKFPGYIACVRPVKQRIAAYWDVASTFSLIVNIILVGVLLVMAFQIKNLKTTLNGLTGLGNNALGGLYANFVKMDQASINTTISVDSQIPINLSVPVTQNTTVVLTSNVNIPNVHVVINTGGLAINSIASVTLPAGTSLPIALNLTIPIQSTIPISLQVPVSIRSTRPTCTSHLPACRPPSVHFTVC